MPPFFARRRAVWESRGSLFRAYGPFRSGRAAGLMAAVQGWCALQHAEEQETRSFAVAPVPGEAWIAARSWVGAQRWVGPPILWACCGVVGVRAPA